MKFIQTTTPIQICDIGAGPASETEFIEILLDKTNSNIIGFEPNKDEFIKLEQSLKFSLLFPQRCVEVPDGERRNFGYYLGGVGPPLGTGLAGNSGNRPAQVHGPQTS